MTDRVRSRDESTFQCASAGPLPSVLLNFLSSLVMPVVTQPPNSVNFSDDEDLASDRWNLRIDELLIIIT